MAKKKRRRKRVRSRGQSGAPRESTAGAGPATEPAGAEPPAPPRLAVLQGLVAGTVLTLPALTLGLSILAWLGMGHRETSPERILRMVIAFAGVPAVLTWGGIARLAARTAIAPRGGVVPATLRAGLAGAAAGAGLAVIAAIPLSLFPKDPMHELGMVLGIALAGSGAGALSGAATGLLLGGQARRSRGPDAGSVSQ